MQKSIRTYFRPEPRCSQKAQDTAAGKFSGKIIPYTDLDDWFRDMRRGDVVGVPFFHRLASTAADLKAVRSRLREAGVTVLEIDSGRKTDGADPGAEMVHEALDFYARRGMTKAEAQAMGRAGAAMSPVTKSRTDRMPLELAEEILNNHETYPTLKIAIRAINNALDGKGKKFKRRYNEAFVYRMAHAGKLNLKNRRSGPKVKR